MVISKIQLPNEETGIDLNDARIHIYRSLTGTAAKTSKPYYCARWDASDSLVSEYVDGMVVCIKVPVAGNNTYGTAFQINDLGYKPVVFNVNSTVGARYGVNSVVWATYNATQTGTLYINANSATTITGCWQVMDYDSNTTSIYTLVHYRGTGMVTGGTLYRYCLCLTRPDEHIIPFHSEGSDTTASTATDKVMTTELFDPFGGIYAYITNAAVAEDATVALSTMNYQYVSVDFRYSTNCGTTLTANKMIYLVAEKPSDDSPYMRLAAPYYTQELPTTADGKYYIFLGYTYSTSALELYADHPIFYHNGTRICTYSGTDHTANDPRISSVDYDMSTGTGVPATQAIKRYSDLITSEVYSSIMRTMASLFLNNSIVFVNDSSDTATLGLTNFGSNAPTLQISTDNVTWTNWDYSGVSISPNNKLYVRGQNLQGLGKSSSVYSTFTISGIVVGGVRCYGNSAALIDYSDPSFDIAGITAYTFYRLFKNCKYLLTAPTLPATVLANSCYREMFYGCSRLSAAPELPAESLASHCYAGMFYGSGITVAPKLPAEALASYCYYQMFYNSAVNVSPDLDAQYGADYCYSYMFAASPIRIAPRIKLISIGSHSCDSMFMYCTNLTEAADMRWAHNYYTNGCYSMYSNCSSLKTPLPELLGTPSGELCLAKMFYGCTKLTEAPDLPATSLSPSCYQEMFYGCTSLVQAPALPATTLESSCYMQMFQGCTSLVTAPVLPATTLANGCYARMFEGCSSLNYIKAMFTTTPGVLTTGNWVKDVAATGTFVKNSEASWSETGNNGIPTGWTVETASE